MPCYNTSTAWLLPSGVISFKKLSGVTQEIQMPCGSCTGCRTKRVQDWSTRAAHEASLYPRSLFVTLTYAPEHLPLNGALEWTHVQSFLKRLRRRVSYKSNARLRYYANGEYGEKHGRPHYHLLVFGWIPDDLRPAPMSQRGHPQFHSVLLTFCWRKGLALCSPVDRTDGGSVAAYITSYCLKTLVNADKNAYLERIDEHGEIIHVPPEFNRMSTRPGIGASWLDEFETDLQHGYVINAGRKTSIPRYYRRRIKANNPTLAATLMAKTHSYAAARPAESSPERLATIDLVHRAKIKIKGNIK